MLNIENFLICPQCLKKGEEVVLSNLNCERCNSKYEKENNIPNLKIDLFDHQNLKFTLNKGKENLKNKFFSNLKQESILFDIGGGEKYFKTTKEFRNSLSKLNYFVVDLSLKRKINLAANAEILPIKSESADYVLCWSVLEHVTNPSLVIQEIHRILKPGGKVLTYVPFIYAFHGEPDYHRLTHLGLCYLFRQFSNIEIQENRSFLDTRNYFGNPFYSIFPFNLIYKLIDKIFSPVINKLSPEIWKQSSGFILYANKNK